MNTQKKSKKVSASPSPSSSQRSANCSQRTCYALGGVFDIKLPRFACYHVCELNFGKKLSEFQSSLQQPFSRLFTAQESLRTLCTPPIETMYRTFVRKAAATASGKDRVVVLGCGWGGFSTIINVDKEVPLTVVSPSNHFLFTPLLPSTAVGTLEFRCIEEPVRYAFCCCCNRCFPHRW